MIRLKSEKTTFLCIPIGFIKHEKNDKSLGIIYESRCSDWTLDCDANTDSVEQHFWELVKSVKFEE